VTWQVFGAVAALAMLVSLVATVPSGDRTTIVLAVWCWLVGTAVTAAFVDALVNPLPFEARGRTNRMRGGFAETGGAGGDFGGGDCGGGGDCS
jgi:hypothetical protein